MYNNDALTLIFVDGRPSQLLDKDGNDIFKLLPITAFHLDWDNRSSDEFGAHNPRATLVLEVAILERAEFSGVPFQVTLDASDFTLVRSTADGFMKHNSALWDIVEEYEQKHGESNKLNMFRREIGKRDR